MAVNQFADMTNAEFRRRFNGYMSSGRVSSAPMLHLDESVESLPAEIDWTTRGVVTPIKNQEQCGSCWAFSAVASTESQHAIKTWNLVSLSEQVVERDFG